MTAPVNRPLATGRLFRLVLAACVASFLADGLLTGYLPLFAAQGTNDSVHRAGRCPGGRRRVRELVVPPARQERRGDHQARDGT